MVKTQVQIPDYLFKEAKRIAVEGEMSFAQVVRQGLEAMVRRHPPGRIAPDEWKVPAPADLGAAMVPEEDWTALCHE